MFYSLTTNLELIGLTLFLAGFFFLAWQRLDWAAALVIFSSPAYLLKINIFDLPGTVLELEILLLIVVWLIKKIIKKEKIIQGFNWQGAYLWPVGLIIFGATLAAIWSPEPGVSAGILKSWVFEPLLFVWILSDLIKERRQISLFIFAWLAAGSGVALISLAAGQMTFDGRLVGFYLSPNQLAMTLAPILVLLPGAWFWWPRQRARGLIIFVGVITFLALYFTYSSGAWLAVLGAIVFWGLVGWRQRIFSFKKTVGSLLLVFFLFGSFWLAPKLIGKFNNWFLSDQSSMKSRLIIWQVAGRLIKENWLVGLGPGVFQKPYLAYQKDYAPYPEWAVPHPHNLWLAWWLQAGLAGLVGFSWLAIRIFRDGFKNLNQTKQPLILALMAVWVCLFLHGLVDTTIWKNDLALVFVISIVLSYKAGR